jgi:ubiquinone/menaquinone biosynthesis C-methylase UbiE
MIVDISKQRLNYDKIAHLYDEPIRDYAVDPNLVNYLQQQPDSGTMKRILDLGCGTGKQLTADSKSLSNIQFVGMDLFSGMLAVAQKRGPTVAWVQGDNANPPFAPNSFDYITNQFSYQHVQQQEKMVAELYQLLRWGGRFVLNNIDPWHMREWAVYHFFPTTWELDSHDFLPVDTLVSLMETVGFAHIEVSRHTQMTEMTLDEIYTYASRRTAASQFMAISDEDYASSIQSLEAQIKSMGGNTTFQSRLCFLTITGDKA